MTYGVYPALVKSCPHLSVHGAKDGAGDEEWHDDGKSSQRLLGESDSNGGRLEHLQWSQDGEVGEIRQKVEESRDQHPDGDGQGKIPVAEIWGEIVLQE